MLIRVLRPNPEGVFFINWKEWEGGVWKDVFSNCISQVHAQWRVLRVERIFMAPEYESTSRKNAITLFPRAVRSLVLISSQGT